MTKEKEQYLRDYGLMARRIVNHLRYGGFADAKGGLKSSVRYVREYLQHGRAWRTDGLVSNPAMADAMLDAVPTSTWLDWSLGAVPGGMAKEKRT
jgi:hypothetical protein